MTSVLIKNWNSVVKKQDIVYHCGDFAMNMKKENIEKIAKSLNGRITLIRGNHDDCRVSFYRDIFYDFCPYSIILNDFFILSHKPLFVTENMPFVNIHGHLHNGGHEGEFNTGKHHFNVSIECIEYKPILFDKIKEHFKA